MNLISGELWRDYERKHHCVILIILGIVALAYQRISYTTREKVLNTGPIEASKEPKGGLTVPSLLSGAKEAHRGRILTVSEAVGDDGSYILLDFLP
jgi:hypothetical protein